MLPNRPNLLASKIEEIVANYCSMHQNDCFGSHVSRMSDRCGHAVLIYSYLSTASCWSKQN